MIYLFFFFFSFLRNKHTHIRESERGSNIKICHKLPLKVMVTFKGVWGKLYYTQHTFLNNVRQLPICFFLETNIHTHTWQMKRSSNTKTYHKLHSKIMITFKGVWGKLYYTQHILLSNVRQLSFFFFFLRNKLSLTHTQGRGKEI